MTPGRERPGRRSRLVGPRAAITSAGPTQRIEALGRRHVGPASATRRMRHQRAQPYRATDHRPRRCQETGSQPQPPPASFRHRSAGGRHLPPHKTPPTALARAWIRRRARTVKLAPHPRHWLSLLRFLLPRAVRHRHRERLRGVRLDTLPADRSPVLDLVARHGRRLLRGPPPRRGPPAEDARQPPRAQGQHRMPAAGASTPGHAPGAADAPSQDLGERGEKGYRRRKLAAMAGNLYRSGQQAVTDMRESYAQSRARALDDAAVQGSTHIPGAFPDVAIASQGDEQMVLFPSYAKRHVKKDWSRIQADAPQIPQTSPRDEEYWRQEWEKTEDEKALVDVDVRGWIYSPHVGPMTRRNRMLMGLARQLSGIPRPDQSPGPMAADQPPSRHQAHEEMRDQESIAQEAALIERRGQQERRVAYSGGYSEPPLENAVAGTDTALPYRARRRGSYTPDSAPGSPVFSARQNSNVNELTEAELAVANANLMARVAPFMTTPLVALPITLFFYNETRSRSRTVLTNDAGHFMVRAPLDFVPTSVRVLANERLSATQEIKITEPRGVSLISDVDDTIKRSNISAGAREIFRNTFVRDLGDLGVDGVKEWYTEMHDLGVAIHYCSNSPWQLFPVLASFFKQAGLPPGSLHLKQYSGMLQGIFEPVAERKKTTLNRLMRDFPERKFILVGDSGEADLEVYTELALANPGRILAVFIRDVTTPERTAYFDSSFELTRCKSSSLHLDDGRSFRQNSPPVAAVDDKTPTGPVMGTLIDFSEEPEEVTLDQSAALEQVKRSNSNKGTCATDLLSARKQPPPRPVKPPALRSTPSSTGGQGFGLGLVNDTPVSSEAPPPPPRGAAWGGGLLHPLSQMQNSSQTTVAGSDTTAKPRALPAKDPQPADSPPPPLPRRRAAPSLKSLSPRLFGHGPSSNSDVDFDPLPPSAAPPPSLGLSYYRSGSRSGGTTPSGGSPTLGAQGVNKKLELWRRRLARAHEVLDQQGVALYTWRRGQDVCVEAVATVRQALEDIDKEGGRRMQRRK
ncbi:ATP-dependent RNA helicase DRS1, partial [Tolypocladium capitatum]